MKAAILIFLGPPGAGKGTQARILSKRLAVPHISTGDILRDTALKKTSLGLAVKAKMDQGELVPDEVVCKIVEERIAQPDSQKGAILDGFPRTVVQARFLDDILLRTGQGQASVLNLRIEPATVVKRLTGRWICPVCGEIYNEFLNPPRQDLVCDKDGSKLVKRSDDNEETVRQRLLAYERETKPLIDYYQQRNRLYDVDASAKPDVVACKVLKAIEEET